MTSSCPDTCNFKKSVNRPKQQVSLEVLEFPPSFRGPVGGFTSFTISSGKDHHPKGTTRHFLKNAGVETRLPGKVCIDSMAKLPCDTMMLGEMHQRHLERQLFRGQPAICILSILSITHVYPCMRSCMVYVQQYICYRQPFKVGRCWKKQTNLTSFARFSRVDFGSPKKNLYLLSLGWEKTPGFQRLKSLTDGNHSFRRGIFLLPPSGPSLPKKNRCWKSLIQQVLGGSAPRNWFFVVI